MKNTLAILSLAVVVTMMSGCVKETTIDNTDIAVPEGMVRIKINTNGSEFQTPSTRGMANETNIDDVWVLVFKGTDYDNATFTEAVKSTVTGSELCVTLTQATGDHKLLVVANADAFINAKKASLATKTLAEAIAILQYGDPYNTTAGNGTLATIQTAMPFADQAMSIPMSEVLSVSGISSATEINATGAAGGGALELRRITAKVEVDASDVYSTFVINKVAAFQGGRSSVSLIPGDGDAIESGGTFVDYYKGNYSLPEEIISSLIAPVSAVDNNTSQNPVYVYESTGTPSFIIISGAHNGSTSFYKLRFAKADGTNYDIKRNYKYIFKITSVSDGVVGYPTLKSAIDGVESNITGQVVEVKEGTSTDIIDNGQYYLATDCSEIVIYSLYTEYNSYLGGIPLLTVTTNAPTGTSPSTITTVGTGTSTVFTVNQSSLTPPVGTGSTVTTTNITLNTINMGITYGTITIKLGSLTKTIKVKRKYLLPYGGLEAVGTATDKFTAGVIDPSSTLPGFALSTDGTKISGVKQFVSSTSSGMPVHLCADNGKVTIIAYPTISETKGLGVAYLSRAGIEGSSTPNRVKLLVRQNYFKLTPIKLQYIDGEENKSGYWPYVGAFWKHNEVGERLIAMQNTTNSAWTATVMNGTDWIELDTNYSGTPPNNDHPSQTTRINGGLTSVSGSGTTINFRIGLKSTYTPTPDNPVRYGLVVVNYEGSTKSHPIFIRQGEAPDVIFPNATEKWSPYNLATTTFPDIESEGELIDNNGGKEVFYPSQAGRLFQWNSLYAWHPTSVVTWADKTHAGTSWLLSAEPCPLGYKTPTKDQHVTTSVTSSIWGYYADGFFDRRVISANNFAVSPTSVKAAYIGRIFFNPYNIASLFLPAAGGRYYASSNGIWLYAAGSYGYYWSSTASSTLNYVYYRFFSSDNGAYTNDDQRSNGFSVRCVKE